MFARRRYHPAEYDVIAWKKQIPGAEELNMKTAAIPISKLQLHLLSRSVARLPYFVELMKPRVMILAVFTALVGMITAPAHLDALPAVVAVLAITAGAGAAGVLNMWYDADVDAIMTRTAMRPIPRGKVSQIEALIFGVALAICAFAALAFAANVTAAALLAGAILFYVVVYTAWLKRYTRQNIVIGGAAGALPPVIGWVAVSGEISLEPLALFLIIFFWTPPHFWALALNRTGEYARAGIPVLPVVAGRAATTRQILIYSTLLLPISELPWMLGFAGRVYGATTLACGAIFVSLAVRLAKSSTADRRAAQRLFAFSIAYLFALFTALLIAGTPNRDSRILFVPSAWAASPSSQAEHPCRAVQTMCHSAIGNRDEV
jgi:heme o synthase